MSLCLHIFDISGIPGDTPIDIFSVLFATIDLNVFMSFLFELSVHLHEEFIFDLVADLG